VEGKISKDEKDNQCTKVKEIYGLRRRVHTYIAWICKCVKKTTGCGKGHKYTNMGQQR